MYIRLFNRRINNLRGKSGLTQKELSARLGMARTTYSGYENGAREPDHQTLQKFADYYDVTIDYLLGRTDDPNKKIKNEETQLKPQDKKILDELHKLSPEDQEYVYELIKKFKKE